MQKTLITDTLELERIVKEAVDAAISKQEGKDILISRMSAAERLHVDVSTLWRWSSSYLRPIKIGRKVYYRERDIQRLEHGEITV